uniref:transposase n=1 Tax=Klebsiella pneumoniae TaxID=573 RepID=UPI0015E852E0
MSAAKLRQYSGSAVVHHCHDHRTQQTLSQEEMIGRYISHIPTKHFKWCIITAFCSVGNGASCCLRCMKPCEKKWINRASPR